MESFCGKEAKYHVFDANVRWPCLDPEKKGFHLCDLQNRKKCFYVAFTNLKLKTSIIKTPIPVPIMALSPLSASYVSKWTALPVIMDPKTEKEDALNIQVSKFTRKVYVSCPDFDATVLYKNDTMTHSIYYPKDVDKSVIDSAFNVLWEKTIKPLLV